MRGLSGEGDVGLVMCIGMAEESISQDSMCIRRDIAQILLFSCQFGEATINYRRGGGVSCCRVWYVMRVAISCMASPFTGGG